MKAVLMTLLENILKMFTPLVCKQKESFKGKFNKITDFRKKCSQIKFNKKGYHFLFGHFVVNFLPLFSL